MTLAEAAEDLGKIIRIQSRVIDELFLICLQHIQADEAAELPCMQLIKEAAELRTKFERKEEMP